MPFVDKSSRLADWDEVVAKRGALAFDGVNKHSESLLSSGQSRSSRSTCLVRLEPKVLTPRIEHPRWRIFGERPTAIEIHQLITPHRPPIQLNRNHGDRVDSAERAGFPKTTTRLPQPQARLESRQSEESRQRRKKMVQRRWAGLQDTSKCDYGNIYRYECPTGPTNWSRSQCSMS